MRVHDVAIGHAVRYPGWKRIKREREVIGTATVVVY